MRNIIASTIFIAAAVFVGTANAQTPSRDQISFCERAGQAAQEAADQRDARDSPESTKAVLEEKYQSQQVSVAMFAAKSYRDLRHYAMYDFVRAYCMISTRQDKPASELEKMFLQNRFRRNVECSKAGRSRKAAYIECWNEQAEKALKQRPASKSK